MAQITDLVRAEGKGFHLVAGYFLPAGTSAPTTPTTTAPGWSVSRTGVGAFKITFTEKYATRLAGVATVQLNALADTDVQLGAFTAATSTASAFQVVNIKTAGVAADIAANANNQVHFVFLFSTHGSVK